MLEGGHGVENHPECGDHHEQHRDGGHGLGGTAGVRLLQEVPEELLVRDKSPGPEVLHVINDQFAGLSLHLLLNVLPPRGKLESAASLKINVLKECFYYQEEEGFNTTHRYSPVVEVIMESKDTHLIRHVKLARPVEVEDGVE